SGWPFGYADTDQALAERAANSDRLAFLEEHARWQRACFEHELLLSSQALAARLLSCRQAGARRDELADNDVLLEAEQLVDLAGDRRFGEHLGRFLERRGGQEGLGVQRCLGHAEQYGQRCRRLAT